MRFYTAWAHSGSRAVIVAVTFANTLSNQKLKLGVIDVVDSTGLKSLGHVQDVITQLQSTSSTKLASTRKLRSSQRIISIRALVARQPCEDFLIGNVEFAAQLIQRVGGELLFFA